MATLEGFDANQVEPMGDFTPIPAGDYQAIATASTWEPTKAKDGEFLKFTFEVLSGEYRGRNVFTRLNLKNKNATAVKIAQSELSSICRAVGVMRPRDSAELHNKPLMVKVALEERNDKPGEFSNRLKGYSPMGSSPAQAPASVAQAARAEAEAVFGGPPTTAPTPAPATPATPPWRR